MTRAGTLALVGRYGLAIALALVGWSALTMACDLLGEPLRSHGLAYAFWVVAAFVTLTQALCMGGTGPGAVEPIARRNWPFFYHTVLAATLALFAVWGWDQFLGAERTNPLGFIPLAGVASALEMAAWARSPQVVDPTARKI